MRCPWCGSPVRISGDRWECGYCGDAGFLDLTPEPELSFTMTVSYTVNYSFDDILNVMTELLQDLAPDQAETLVHSLKKAVLHKIARGLSENPRILPPDKEKQLRQFLGQFFSGFPAADQILEDPQKYGRQYGSYGHLSDSFCGILYRELIESDLKAEDTEFLPDLFVGLYRFHTVFRTDQYDEHYLDWICTHEFPQSTRQMAIFMEYFRKHRT